MRPILLSVLALAVCAETPVERRIRTDLTYLSSPELKGRGNGDPELEKAADFLVQTYRKLGMKVRVERYPFVKGVERLQGVARLGKGDDAGSGVNVVNGNVTIDGVKVPPSATRWTGKDGTKYRIKRSGKGNVSVEEIDD